MTGIADLYLYLNRPNRNRRKRLLAHLTRQEEQQRFVVLSWKRTGSNLLCGILHLHPEICMHNELFNPIDIFTYHPFVLQRQRAAVAAEKNHHEVSTTVGQRGGRWTVQVRDLYPESFLDYIWDQQTVDRVFASLKWRRPVAGRWVSNRFQNIGPKRGEKTFGESASSKI